MEELSSWKEIAAYLGVSVKTAQVWEQNRGLPIRRLPGDRRTQVRALVTELEAWKNSVPQQPPPADLQDPPGPFPSQKENWFVSRKLRLPLALACLLLVAGFSYGLGSGAFRHLEPEAAIVSQNALAAYAADGALIWRKDFGSLADSAYSDGERRIWVGDLDGDGHREVLFIPVPPGHKVEPVPLICLDEKGRERWRFLPGRVLRDSERTYDGPYISRQFAVVGNKIVVSGHHHLYHPSQIAVLDAQGHKLRDYFHAGHLHHLVPATFRGKSVILAGGVNNIRHSATLIALDPERMDGAGMEENGRPAFDGLPPGVEEARILFPRTCLSRKHPYNAVSTIVVKESGFAVGVVEEMIGSDPAAVQYQLSKDLELTDVTPSDVFMAKHILHSPDHKWSEEERDQLRRLIRIR